MTTVWTCQKCGHQRWKADGLTILLDPRYAFGHCIKCRVKRTFARTDTDEPPPDPKAEAFRQRDRGIAQAWAGAGEWREQAWRFLIEYARTHPTVFADDLWEAGLPGTRENRALGPLMKRAEAKGIIEQGDQQRISVKAHGMRHIVWRSLIYGRAE